MDKKDEVSLRGILKYSMRIESYMAIINNNKEGFYNNSMLRDAVSMCIQTIGEYVNDLSNDFKSKHVQIPWKDIYNMRNRFAHGYDGMIVDYIWEAATIYVPELKNYCYGLIETEKK